MNANEPQFWMMISSIVIAICFVVMSAALIAIAVVVKRVVGTVNRVEAKVEPLIEKVNAISEQGKEISKQFNEISSNIATATKYFAESAELIKDEVAELRSIIGHTAVVAKEKVDQVSMTIDRTRKQVTSVTDFIESKVVEPAREIVALMAAVRRALEVLFAPKPKQLNRVYTEDEMFIG